MCLIALLFGACSFRAGYDDVVARCELPTECPSGLCADGLCVPDAPYAGDSPDASDLVDAGVDASADASAGGDGGIDAPPVACGSMFLLRDDFDDGAQNNVWIRRADSGTSVAETGGRLVVDLAAGSAAVAGGYRSKHAYDVRSASLAVTVEKVAGEITALEVRDFGGRGAAIGVANGALLAMTLDGGATITGAQVAYDPAEHLHWRLRESAGTLFWETSRDRATWTALHAQALPMTGTYGFANLLASGQRATAGAAWFDDVNLPVISSPGLCKASSVKDGFDDGTLAPSFNNWVGAGSCSGREAGGRLELSFPGFGDAWCGAETAQLLDLRDDTASVEAVTVPTAANTLTFFEAVGLDGDEVEMLQDGGLLNMTMFRGGSAVTRASVVWNPVSQRFWRLRESAGTTYWETSPDGATWKTEYSKATVIDLSAVKIDMAGGHYAPGPGSAQTIRYDRLSFP